MHERRGEWDLAEGHYLEALARGAQAAEVQADRSRVAWRRGESERARELGVEALALAQEAGATAAAAAANNLLGMLGAGRAHLERSLELARELPDPGIAIAALNNLARDDFAAGELGRAEALLREALELCVVQGDLHHEAALRNNLADVLHHGGRIGGVDGGAQARRQRLRRDRRRGRGALSGRVEPRRVVAHSGVVYAPERPPSTRKVLALT